MSESEPQKLVIVVAKLGNRKCFKYRVDDSQQILTAQELLVPQQTTGVSVTIKPKGKPELKVTMWHTFAFYKDGETTYYKKHDKLTASMFDVGTRLEFMAHSTSVPGMAYDPLPDFAPKYWGMLTSNPKASADTAFKLTTLVGY